MQDTLIEAARRSASRLAALQATGLLDAPTTEALDRLTRLAARMLDVPVAFLSLVDRERDFYLSHSGFSGEVADTRELRGETFCHFGLVGDGPVVIDDTRLKPEHRAVPTVESLGVAAYLGIPIEMGTSEVLGSFCAIDFKPRQWSERDLDILNGLAGVAQAELRLLMMLGESVRGSEAAEAARREAEVRTRTSQQIVNAVSHDLRNPLNSLALALANIEHTATDPTALRSVGIARRQAAFMTELLDDLLDNARVMQGTMTLRVEPLDLPALLQEVAEDSRLAAEASGVQILVAARQGVPSLRLDGRRMRQVINNLVSNALKFTPTGGLIAIDARVEGSRVVIEVADSGRGIDPALAERIFEPYWQSDPQSRSGIGLGLHIARQIIELHGGRISVRPAAGGGAVFVIEMPATMEDIGSQGRLPTHTELLD